MWEGSFITRHFFSQQGTPNQATHQTGRAQLVAVTPLQLLHLQSTQTSAKIRTGGKTRAASPQLTSLKACTAAAGPSGHPTPALTSAPSAQAGT